MRDFRARQDRSLSRRRVFTMDSDTIQALIMSNEFKLRAGANHPVIPGRSNS